MRVRVTIRTGERLEIIKLYFISTGHSNFPVFQTDFDSLQILAEKSSFKFLLQLHILNTSIHFDLCIAVNSVAILDQETLDPCP